MIDTTLIDKLTELAKKEKKIKEYKRRLRIKGRVMATGKTKKDNITVTVERDKQEYKFIIPKSHKERYALVKKMPIGTSISIEGILKFRTVICTRLNILEKGLAGGRQEKLELFVRDYDEKC